MYSQENINLKIVIRVTDKAVFSTTGNHLSNIETLLLQGVWKDQKYPQIASETGYSIEYLKNDIGPKLWKRLSQVFGERVKKANVKIVLQQKLFDEDDIEAINEEKKSEEIHPRGSEEIYLEPTPVIMQKDQSFSTHSGDTFKSSNNHQDSIFSSEMAESEKPSLPWPSLSSPVIHNLPLHETRLIDRDLEVQQILKVLSFEQPIPRISIEGIAGVGKTHLLLEVAHHCLKASQQALTQTTLTQKPNCHNTLPIFDRIIFTSAQSHYCTLHGFLPRFLPERNLQDIFRTILQTLQVNIEADHSTEKVYEQVRQNLLGNRRILLIIDSLDNMSDREEILGFLYGLPSTVKVLVTSRQKTLFPAIVIPPLSSNSALNLIQYLAAKQNLSLTLETGKKLYQITGNIPAAIVHAISLLASGYSLHETSLFLNHQTEKFAQSYKY